MDRLDDALRVLSADRGRSAPETEASGASVAGMNATGNLESIVVLGTACGGDSGEPMGQRPRSTLRMAILSLALGVACASAEPHAQDTTQRSTSVSRNDLGKTVTLHGHAVNRKGGAVLQVGDTSVWLDGLHAWPPGYYEGGDRGRRVVVTGVLAEDHGLPVFVQREGEPIVQGIPVPEGTDLEQASRRFVLRDARWE